MLVVFPYENWHFNCDTHDILFIYWQTKLHICNRYCWVLLPQKLPVHSSISAQKMKINLTGIHASVTLLCKQTLWKLACVSLTWDTDKQTSPHPNYCCFLRLVRARLWQHCLEFFVYAHVHGYLWSRRESAYKRHLNQNISYYLEDCVHVNVVTAWWWFIRKSQAFSLPDFPGNLSPRG